MSRAAKIIARMKVGDRVGVRFGDRTFPGLVIEDLGNLGPKKQQVVRVRSEDPDVVLFQLDLPVDWLEDAPHG